MLRARFAFKCATGRANAFAAWATQFAAKLNGHFNGQRRVVHGDLGDDPGLVYAQVFL